MRKKILDLLKVLEDNKIYGKLSPILEHGKITRAELKISLLEPDLDRFISKLSEERRG